ncbi:MAG TPA: alpha-E domain-containing protein [Phycisphaerae bacterium]
MLSRVAESIYWMSRYVERAENVARFVHVNLHLELDVPALGEEDAGANQWKPLIWTTGSDQIFPKLYDSFTRENVIKFLTFDPDNPNSILSSVRFARENARSIREVISSEMWFTLNRFYLMMRDPQAPARATADPHSFYTDIKTACALFLGETMSTMSHGEGWHFGRIGRLLERADKTSRILDVKYYILLPKVEHVGMPIDTLQWVALLKSASAFEMYRKAFSTITPRNVSKFLLLDLDFPRAVLQCLSGAEDSLREITGTARDTYNNPAEQRLGRLCAELKYTHIDEIIKTGLHEYVDRLQTAINAIDDNIFHMFFEIKSDAVPEEPKAGGTQSQTQTQGQS